MRTSRALAISLGTLAASFVGGSATAGPAACGSRVNNTHAKLLECVTLKGARDHQAALQAIADENGGTRATGTPGYDASVEYVVAQLEAAGYQIELDPFEFEFEFFPPALLQQLTPSQAEYETGVFTGPGSGTSRRRSLPSILFWRPLRPPPAAAKRLISSDFPQGTLP